MPIFTKGTIFNMGGKEYEVVGEGADGPSSCLLYAPRHEKDTADPLTIRLWKAEAKLARGDIMINGQPSASQAAGSSFYPPVTDPLEQIAELKKRIQAIEQRRVFLLKSSDPSGQYLLQDNIVRPNRPFDIWALSSHSDATRAPIQYIRPRAMILTISNNDAPEHFLFNISNQMPPCCRSVEGSIASEGRISINLNPELKTIRGERTDILNNSFDGRIELEVELRLRCKQDTGIATINAQIAQCSYIRTVNAPSLKMDKLTFPEIGNHLITILGINVDIYTAGPKAGEPSIFPVDFPPI